MRLAVFLFVFFAFVVFCAQAQVITIPIDIWNVSRGNLSGSGTAGQVATYSSVPGVLGAVSVPSCGGGQALTSLSSCGSIGNISLVTAADRVLYSPSTTTINATQYRVRDLIVAYDIIDGLGGWARKPALNAYLNNNFVAANFKYPITAWYFNNSNTSQIIQVTGANLNRLFDGDLVNPAFYMPANHTFVLNITWSMIPSWSSSDTLPFTQNSWRGCYIIHSYWTLTPVNATIYTSRLLPFGGDRIEVFTDWGKAPKTAENEITNGVLGMCSSSLAYTSNFSVITIAGNNVNQTLISEIQWYPQEMALAEQPAAITRYTRQHLFNGFFWLLPQPYWRNDSSFKFVPAAIYPENGQGYFSLNTILGRADGRGSFPTFNFDVNATAARFNRGANTQVELHFQSGTLTGGTVTDGMSIGLDANANGRLWQYEPRNLTVGTNNAERVRVTSEGNVGIGTTTPNQRLQVVGNMNVSGTIFYGALVANSPHAFAADSVGYTRICKQAIDGSVVVETVELVDGKYHNVIRLDTAGVCQKSVFDSETVNVSVVIKDGIPSISRRVVTITRNIWDGRTSSSSVETTEKIPEYSNTSEYSAGSLFTYNGNVYEVIQPHTAQDDWLPDKLPSIYRRYIFPSQVAEWRQPLGSSDCYQLGAIVQYQGSIWRNTGSSCNVWTPGVYGWVKQ